LTKIPLARLALGCLLGFAPAYAANTFVTPNFGTGSGVTGFSWPGTSDASGSTTGVVLTGPIDLDGGAIVITASAAVECDVGTTAGTCGTSTGLSTGTAYGLGVGDGRISAGETLTLTVEPGFNVTNVELISFTVTGFSSGEVATFVLDGGSTHSFDAPGGTPPYTDTPDLNFTNTLVFGSSDGNYSLASLDLEITTTATLPEPATFGLAGFALIGMVVARRKLRV
jgi:hypothetical protein